MDTDLLNIADSPGWIWLIRAMVAVFVALQCPVSLSAQGGSTELRQVLDRLEGLERANRELTEEVRALRGQLAAANNLPAAETAGAEAGIPVEEKVTVQERQLQEQAQTKVESGQRFPIRLKGMLLFNTFLNSKQGGGGQYPTLASHKGDANGGSTLRQSAFGFDYQGPEVWNGGKLRASLLMDFFGGPLDSPDMQLRLRTATMQVDWKTRSLVVGIDKPIFAPRDPTSLAQVGLSPLTGAGNLWMWIPQVRAEQSFRLSESSQVRAQAGIVQTKEVPSYQAADYFAEVEPTRPGAEGRVEFAHSFGNGGRLELAPGFHVSTSHVAHAAVPSRLYSIDWLISPWRPLSLTGAYYKGQNLAHLGTGGAGQGFVVAGAQHVQPLHSEGGWAQLTFDATQRLSFHAFSGRQDNRDSILPTGQIGINLAYGANFFFRMAPNVIVSLEASQVRTAYLGLGHRLNNHYDLALAYLF